MIWGIKCLYLDNVFYYCEKLLCLFEYINIILYRLILKKIEFFIVVGFLAS